MAKTKFTPKGTNGNGFSPKSNGDQLRRFTLAVPRALDQNLEIFALNMGCSKSDVIKTVLRDFLTAQGLQPDKELRGATGTY